MPTWNEKLSEIIKEEQTILETYGNHFTAYRDAAHKLLINDVREAFHEFKKHLDDTTNLQTDIVNEVLKETIVVQSPEGFEFIYSVFPYFRENGFTLTTHQILEMMKPEYNKFLEKNANEDGYSVSKESLLYDLVTEFQQALTIFNSGYWKNANSHIKG